DDGIAKARAGAWAEIHHAFRHANLLQQLDELGGNGWRITGRLQDHGVAADDGSQRHAGHDGTRKIPRRNYRAYAKRDVAQRIVLARHLYWRFNFRKPQSLAGIEFAEVDGLGNVRVGLSPVLADFENQPRHVIHFAFAHTIGGAEQQTGTLFHRGAAPRGKGPQRRLYRGLNVLFAGLLMNAYNLRRLRGIQRLDLVGGLDALDADDEVILPSQLSAHAFDGGPHLACVVFVAEIIKRFVDK